MQSISQHQTQFDRLTSDRVYFRDQDFRLISANDAFLKDLCCESFEEVEGTNLNEIGVQAEALQDLLLAAEEQILQTESSQIRKQVPCKISGNNFAVSIECHPVFADNGKFAGLACRYSIESNPEPNGIEKLLLDALLKNTEDCFYFKDLDSRFIRVSDVMVNKLGAADIESMIGTTDFDYWDFDCAEGFFKSEQEILNTRQSLIGVCEEEIRNDGRKTWVVSSKMPLEDGQGNVFGTFGVSRDITDLKETEIKLKETNQQLIVASRRAGMAEIASNVIHNVGNVLNSVKVSLSVSRSLIKDSGIKNLTKTANLLDENKDVPNFLSEDAKGKILPEFLRMSATKLEETQQKSLAELELLSENLDHIQMIISMQQKHAGAGAGAVIEKIEVASIIEDAIRIGQCTTPGEGVQIEIKSSSAKLEAETDKHRVLQVLINLIRNAKHACEDAVHKAPKRILVSLEQNPKGFFTIEVSDNGTGIDSSNLTSIFNHGFTTKKNGSGFGLHSSANAAKELGGSLVATSPGKGKGAAFVLTLPMKSNLRSEVKTTPEIFTIGGAEVPSTPPPINS